MSKIEFGIKRVEAIISPFFNLPSKFSELEIYQRDFELSNISPLERRRFGSAAKCAFSLFSLFDFNNAPFIVFSSQSGEINRCFNMLHTLKDDFFVSPNAFSFSVLNATSALLAIDSKNNLELSAISSNSSLEYGILCAWLKISESSELDSKEAIILSYHENLDFSFNKDVACFMLALHISKTAEICASLEFLGESNTDSKSSALMLLKNIKKPRATWDENAWRWNIWKQPCAR